MASSKLESLDRLILGATLAPDASVHEDVVLGLFDDCAPGLRRYVRSFGLSPEAAEDVVQEVFLALFCHLERGRPRTNLRAWVFRVGHLLALKQRERLAIRSRREPALDSSLSDTVADPATDVERQLLEGARSRRLQAVVRALPERDRQCVHLRAAGLRYRDIASALQVSLGAVAKSMARALERLEIADGGDGRARR